MTKKEGEKAGGGVIAEGQGGKGSDYDPTRPECGEEGRGRPVTHGTPLAPDEYARLKEKARHGEPEDRTVPAQRDR